MRDHFYEIPLRSVQYFVDFCIKLLPTLFLFIPPSSTPIPLLCILLPLSPILLFPLPFSTKSVNSYSRSYGIIEVNVKGRVGKRRRYFSEEVSGLFQ